MSRRTIAVALVVGLIGLTLGLGPVAAQSVEQQDATQTESVGETTEDVSIEEESTESVSEDQTVTETETATAGDGDAVSDDILGFGDDFLGADFVDSVLDDALVSLDTLFE